MEDAVVAEEPILNSPESNPAAQESTAETEETPPNPPPSETDIPAGIEDKPNSHTGQNNVREWWKGIVETLTLIAVVWYACIASRQLKPMQDAAKATQDAANAASTQTTLVRQQLEGTMAAVLEVNAGFDLDAKRFVLSLTNSGHVIARHLRATLQITKRALPSERLVGTPVPINFTLPEIGLTQEWVPHEYPLDLSQAEITSILDTKSTLRVEGTLTYNNGFEVVSHPVCYSYLAVQAKDKTGKIIQSWTNPVLCDEYAIQLRGALIQKRETLKRIYGQQQRPH